MMKTCEEIVKDTNSFVLGVLEKKNTDFLLYIVSTFYSSYR